MELLNTRTYETVEGIQYLGHNLEEANKLLGKWHEPIASTMELLVELTPGVEVLVESDDWIVIKANGDLAVHKPTTFGNLYVRKELFD